MSLLNILTSLDFPQPFQIKLPDGSVHTHGQGKPDFVIHFKTEAALSDVMRQASLGFGEAYMREEIDVEGDIHDAVTLGYRALQGGIKPSFSEKIKFLIAYLSRRNTREGSRKNIEAHYDLGNDFYALWLDKEMQYTCAYFKTPGDTLEKAQIQKLEHVCRKVRLKKGDTVVEAGCGWGAFAVYAARKYGVKVRSYNISKEQIEFARARAKKLGIKSSQVEYVLDDYRTIPDSGKKYDKFVSIGMLEHVGLENYRTLYDIIATSTKEGSRAMVHSIGRIAPKKPDPWLEKYIFPGCYIPSLSEMITPVESTDRDLHVVDVENLRYHYALTLDHWARRLEKNVKTIRDQYGEAFVRMFRLYLRSAAAGFRNDELLLYQVLLSNGRDNSAPLTRQAWYK
ncbi:MAG: cyclopropane-fatty-acyl-phospholipid synthase family protein [Spirochaetia bacterium]|nr:cyclopropane-fatty-acyl-phospholipid synthase family protein [Spirochaetia bacterium]